MAPNRYDKIGNTLCTGIHNRMKMPMEKLLSINPELKPLAEVGLEAFLLRIRGKIDSIQGYVNSNIRAKDLVITDKTDCLLFSYTIKPNLTSTCELQLTKSVSIDIPCQFIDSKVFPSKGYVYFLKSDFGYKIGCAKNLDRRIRTFEVKLPFKVQLHSFIYCKQFCEFERELHKLMNHKLIDGEWFNLTDEDFIDLDKYISNTHRHRQLVGEEAIHNG